MALFSTANNASSEQSQITFYGAVFTKHGMKPNPAKVQALQDLPTPINQKELKSFVRLN